MATRIAPPPNPVYEQDFYAWSKAQAGLLRARDHALVWERATMRSTIAFSSRLVMPLADYTAAVRISSTRSAFAAV